jgi:hypothetical protein
MLDELHGPFVAHVIEEATYVRIEHPVHPLPLDARCQRIQRLMRAATGPEPVRKALEVDLIDLVEELIQHLRSKRLIRRSRHARAGGKSHGQIVDAISIRERPAEVEDRVIPGHWEGSAQRHQEQSHRNAGGTTFAFYHPGQSAWQIYSNGRRRTEPAGTVSSPRL